MAKSKDTPALTFERIYKALKAGSLKKVVRIHGTKVLVVVSGRIRRTWVKKGKKKHGRIRLNRVYLNPRWIPLPADYAVSVSELGKMSKKELYPLGIVYIKGSYKLLIYQQLDDLASLQRQIKHIKPQYDRKSSELWKRLEKSDPLNTMFASVTLDRIEDIDAISTHLVGREYAVAARLQRLTGIQDFVKGRLVELLELIPKDGGTQAEGITKGLDDPLSRQHVELERLLDDKPHAHRAGWARYHISKAQERLLENDIKRARRHMQKAIDWL